MFKLEVIAFNIESCSTIQQSGAHRIELCDNPQDGGTTPSFGFIKAARERVSIELFPIIRPRGGDFLFSDDEFDIMKADVKVCKALGCDGVVIGLLQADGSVDRKRTSRLVELAYPMDVTFHRAFDRVRDPWQALEDVISCGCTRILTSGLHPSADLGKDVLKQLVEQAGHRIGIMPGSGVRASNISEIARYTGAEEFHTSARSKKTATLYSPPAMDDDPAYVVAGGQEIEQCLIQLASL